MALGVLFYDQVILTLTFTQVVDMKKLFQRDVITTSGLGKRSKEILNCEMVMLVYYLVQHAITIIR